MKGSGLVSKCKPPGEFSLENVKMIFSTVHMQFGQQHQALPAILELQKFSWAHLAKPLINANCCIVSHFSLFSLFLSIFYGILSPTDTLAVGTSTVATETLQRSSLICEACVCVALWAPESLTISETSPPCNVHANQTAMASFLQTPCGKDVVPSKMTGPREIWHWLQQTDRSACSQCQISRG